jgi:aspartate/methionine/tyrosine aminotransferase
VPKFPDFSNKLSMIKGAVFEKYRSKMLEFGPDLVRLHIGDSYLPPVYPLPVEREFLDKNRDFSRYGDTFGIEDLRDALTVKVIEDNQIQVAPNNILVTTGATNALSAAAHSVLEPGDEILVLTPCWPIFPGIVHSTQATISEIPFYMKLYEDPEMDVIEHLNQYISDHTVAIYLNTPNNPSGKVLNQNQQTQIAEFAKRHKLWVISDEAYDGLTFDGHVHHSIAALPDMFEQTITVFTFSKIFTFAGLRLGYAVGNQELIINLNKILVHQIYSSTIITQQMMIEPVKTRHQWMDKVQRHYQMLRDQCIKQMDFSLTKPEATYFVFFSIEKMLNGRNYDDIINRCFEEGVSVAPGLDFGKDFALYLRICFTGESPDRLKKGTDRLRKVLLENI